MIKNKENQEINVPNKQILCILIIINQPYNEVRSIELMLYLNLLPRCMCTSLYAKYNRTLL